MNPKAYNPLANTEDDNKPVKLVSKEKAKVNKEKKAIDDIESFLLEENDMWLIYSNVKFFFNSIT